MKAKSKGKTRERDADTCSNCGDKCYLLAAMITEDGGKIHLCEQCLRDSE
jgi:hypothetical protein